MPLLLVKIAFRRKQFLQAELSSVQRGPGLVEGLHVRRWYPASVAPHISDWMHDHSRRPVMRTGPFMHFCWCNIAARTIACRDAGAEVTKMPIR